MILFETAQTQCKLPAAPLRVHCCVLGAGLDARCYEGFPAAPPQSLVLLVCCRSSPDPRDLPWGGTPWPAVRTRPAPPALRGRPGVGQRP
eukprot:6308700-Alexandrium_andersonii.AAC.1